MFNYFEKHDYNPKSECWNSFWIIYAVLETLVCCLSKSNTKNDCPLKISLQFWKNTAGIKLPIPQTFVIKICMHTLTHSLYICHKKYKCHIVKSGITQRDCICSGTVKLWVQQDRNWAAQKDQMQTAFIWVTFLQSTCKIRYSFPSNWRI